MFDDFPTSDEEALERIRKSNQEAAASIFRPSREPLTQTLPALRGTAFDTTPQPVVSPFVEQPAPQPFGPKASDVFPVGPTEPKERPFTGPMPDDRQGPAEMWNPVVSGPSGSTQYSFTRGPEGNWSGTQRVGDQTVPVDAMAFSRPGVLPGTSKPGSPEYAQRAFDEAFERYAQSPVTGDQYRSGSPQARMAMEMATRAAAPHLQAVENQGWIDRAAAAHRMESSPQALKTQAYKNVFGAGMAQGLSPQEAHAQAVAAAQSFNPDAAPTSPQPMATGKRDFFGQNLDVLPKEFRYQGPNDKIAYSGTAEVFGQPQAENLIQRLLLLPPEEQKAQLQKLMSSNVGPKISDTLAARFGAAFATSLPEDMPRDVGTVTGLAPGVEVKDISPTFWSRLGQAAPFGGTAAQKYKLNKIVSKTTGREVPIDRRLLGDTEKAKKIMESEKAFMDLFWPYFAPQR